jgi:hypothetical protein
VESFNDTFITITQNSLLEVVEQIALTEAFLPIAEKGFNYFEEKSRKTYL